MVNIGSLWTVTTGPLIRPISNPYDYPFPQTGGSQVTTLSQNLSPKLRPNNGHVVGFHYFLVNFHKVAYSVAQQGELVIFNHFTLQISLRIRW